ncbi:MAG: hypothetical protein PHU95_03550 [Candidatus Thermoplasmatota archaeon]|nr:hypothetical protein [Candidatus Thermoplasmatota archaeon]
MRHLHSGGWYYKEAADNTAEGIRNRGIITINGETLTVSSVTVEDCPEGKYPRPAWDVWVEVEQDDLLKHTRKELDEMAAERGLTPTDYPNKKALAEAIATA